MRRSSNDRRCRETVLSGRRLPRVPRSIARARWAHRAAPRVDARRGVWRGGLAWDEQTYGSGEPAGIREERLRGDVGLATWLTPDLQLSVTLGVDRWQLMSGEVTKTMSVGGAI